ncbi:NADP transhydrogenase subunit alpha [Iocasia frigidifontis]|uniref:NADP transhydrogenase subunit alpha n=1 Tax=Iocasia fonsfrigidae TaxID=2682810 RepID=A0A8A7KA61_9FIRM|nr:NADP transhydrogenase subunit alpha [Iocasia fonsfrigidae]
MILEKFAVLGAGNGGQAMAAYLALNGCKVNLYNRSRERLEPIIKKGGIFLSGIYQGFGRLNKITDNIEEALSGTDIIMVVTPAVAHRYLAEKMSPYLRDGQKIILNPGRTGGTLEFYNILKSNNCNADLIISETQTFLYASRVVGPARAKIFGVKNRVAIAAFPSNRTREIIDKLYKILPQFSPVENVMKTSLDNIGSIFHPAPTLLNMAWIESTDGNFSYYQQGISPAISKIMEKMDQERMNVAESLGISPISALDWLRMSYGARGKSLYELLQNNKQYEGIGAPEEIKHRYIFEDVPMGLVPISSLANYFGISTPTIDMIIELANLVYDTDFRKIGRTVKSLGLLGLNKKEIIDLVNKGNISNVEVHPKLRRTLYKGLDNIIYGQFAEYQKEVE